ncbi:MAG: DUF2461 domain-containing protein [Planctomycetota bacterium]
MPTLTKKTVVFLKELQANNNRDWFQENKKRFEADAQGPMLQFLTELAVPMQKVSKHIVVDPKKSGGSMMRIYRDTRFSKNKDPYNTHLSAQFRHAIGKDVQAPGFFLRIAPDAVTLGCGIWQPDTAALTKIRDAIDKKQAAWKKVVADAAFKKTFGELAGESLKRPPRGYDAEHPLVTDLKRKDFVGFTTLKPGVITKDTFLGDVIDSYKAGKPLMKFICAALDLAY